ncbi:hypothetical protein QQP08_023267 [Theobroma cacao]|nr:hypothetical protein QQP08_023267 [Theobroma cacao]
MDEQSASLLGNNVIFWLKIRAKNSTAGENRDCGVGFLLSSVTSERTSPIGKDDLTDSVGRAADLSLIHSGSQHPQPFQRDDLCIHQNIILLGSSFLHWFRSRKRLGGLILQLSQWLNSFPVFLQMKDQYSLSVQDISEFSPSDIASMTVSSRILSLALPNC